MADATGGTKTTPGDGWIYHEFTSSGTLTFTEGGLCRYVVVGGGGGGGNRQGGGGGGGGVKTGSFTAGVQSYTITVGAGGAGGSGTDNPGANGGLSEIVGLISAAGGGGGSSRGPDDEGLDGASGGGAGASGNFGQTIQGGSATDGGGDGGDGKATEGGGGGGAGPNNGGNAVESGAAGNGGDGLFVAAFDQFGDSGYFGGGGGGGNFSGTAGTGGLGGGADGLNADGTANDGTANTGGGGGGTENSGDPGGDGGSGTVIVAYLEAGYGVGEITENPDEMSTPGFIDGSGAITEQPDTMFNTKRIDGTGAITEDPDLGMSYKQGSGAISEQADSASGLGATVLPPDRDSGVFVEAWDLANQTRIIADVPFIVGGLDITDQRQPPGDGAIIIPASFARLNEIFQANTELTVVQATGGTKTTPGDGYVYHAFTTAGTDTFDVAIPGIVDVLVVGAGGGGGGANYGAFPGGGGGGGEVQLFTNVAVSGSNTVTVGAGGSGGKPGSNPDSGGSRGSNGESTSFLSFTSRGGGGGGSSSATMTPQGDIAGPAQSAYTGGGSTGDTAVVSEDEEKREAGDYNEPGRGTQPGGDGGRGTGSGTFRGGGGGGDSEDGYDGDDATNPGSGGRGTFVTEFDNLPDVTGYGDGATEGWFGGGGGGGTWGAGDTSYTHLGRTNGNGGVGSRLGTTSEDPVPGSGGGGGGSRSQQFGLSYGGQDGATGGVYIRYPDTANGPQRRVLKVYSDSLFRKAFIPERMQRRADENDRTVTLTGRTQEQMLGWAILPAPAWDYGYDTAYFQNFTDPPELLTNGGFTTPLEGSFGDPTPGWSAKGGADHTPCSGCTTGQFGNVIRVNPSGIHTGIQQTVDVVGGQRYVFGTWIEGTVTGKRITIQMDFNGEAASLATPNTSNTFVYPAGSDKLLAELENVARNPASNGQPGGSTDGTVQYTELDVVIPPDCDKLTVSISADHHSSSNPTFYVHGATLTGIGAGLPDEFELTANVDPTTWDTSGSPVVSGDYSWGWTPGDSSASYTLIGPISATTGAEFFTRFFMAAVGAGRQTRYTVYGADASTVISDTGWIAAPTGAGAYIQQDFTGPGSGTIYLEIGVQGTVTNYVIDEIGVFEGRPPASPGQIVLDMLAAVQTEGFIPDVTTDFTASTDSNGELWTTTAIAASFGYGGPFLAALRRLATMGFEFALEPQNLRLGYDTGWVLRVFNGYGTTP